MKLRTTLVLAVLLAVCAGYGYFIVLPRRSSDITLITPPRVLEIAAGEISRIEVEREGRPLYACERRGDQWWLTQPVKAPAVHETIEAIAIAFAYMHEHGTLQDRPDPARASDYGFDAPRVVSRIRVHGQTHTFEIGGDIGAERGQYVRHRETGVIHVLGPSFLGALETPIERMRERRVFVFGKVWASAFSLRMSGEPALRFERLSGVWWMTEPIRDRADEIALQGAFAALTSLSIERFIPRPSEGPDPVDPPVLEMTVEFEGGAPPARAAFGPPMKDTPDFLPCRPSGGEDLGLVRDLDLKPLRRPVREWRSRRLFSTSGEKLRACTIVLHDRRHTARRVDTNEGSAWKIEGAPADWIVDPGGAPGIVLTLAEVPVSDLMDAPEGFPRAGYGLDPPAAVVEIEFDTPGATSRVHRLEAGHGAQRGLGYVYDPERAVILVVKPEIIDRIARGPLNFRSRSLLNLPFEEEWICSVAVRGEEAERLDQRAQRLEEGGKWECVVSGSAPAPADAPRLKGLAEDLERLEALEFIAYEEPDLSGVEPGGVRVTIGIRSRDDPPKTRERVLVIGPPRPDGFAPARLDGDPAIFTVRAGFLEALRRDFREPPVPVPPEEMGPKRE
ncbi:MAG: DUF4340 domain-containing protein [Planctomycetes bacterium]|nr:DUF4340 domain-containing protein [Planctomycetota bacterium]